MSMGVYCITVCSDSHHGSCVDYARLDGPDEITSRLFVLVFTTTTLIESPNAWNCVVAEG